MTLTTNEITLLFAVLVLGWLLGLLTLSGGRARYRALQARNRDLAAENERLHGQIGASSTRITELERQQSGIPARTGAATAATPRDGRDQLSRINGIGRDDEARLNALDIKSYRDLAALGDDDAAVLEERLGVAPGTIARERWREQAEELRAQA